MKCNVLARTVVVVCFCATISACEAPNTRRFLKDNVRLWSDVTLGIVHGYDVIEIGDPDTPLSADAPAVQLGFPNGDTIAVDELTAEYIRAHADRLENAGSCWPDGAERAYLSGWSSFVIHEGEVQAVRLERLDRGAWKPLIGPEGGEDLLSLPLTDEQATAIFGYAHGRRIFYRERSDRDAMCCD